MTRARISESGTDLTAQPLQVRDVSVIDQWAESHFEGNDAAISPLNNEVDFVVSIFRSQMTDGRGIVLCVHA